MVNAHCGNTPILFWQKFRENDVFIKEITKELIWRNIFSVRVNFTFFYTVKCTLWKCQKFTLTIAFLGKNFVKAKHKLLELIWRNIFLVRVHKSFGNYRIFPQEFLKKFRQINFFTKGLYWKSIWRKKVSMWGKTYKSPHCAQLLTFHTYLCLLLISRKFCKNRLWINSRNFKH